MPGALALRMHTAERRYQFIHDRRKRCIESGTPPDDYIIMAVARVKGARQPHRLAQAPADPVALHSTTFFLGHGKARSGLVLSQAT